MAERIGEQFKYMKRPYGRTIWLKCYDHHSVLFGNLMGLFHEQPTTSTVSTLLVKDIREAVMNRVGRSDVCRGVKESMKYENIR